MKANLDAVLSGIGAWAVSVSALLLVLTSLTHRLARPWILVLLVLIGLLAFAWLAARRGDLQPVRAALAYAASGAVVGAFSYALGRALASHSWGIVTLLGTVSVAIGSVSWYARRNNDGAV